MDTHDFITGCIIFAFVWFTAVLCYGIIRWSIWHFRPLIRARQDMYRQIRAQYDPQADARQVQWEENIASQTSNRRYQAQVKQDEKRLQAQARAKQRRAPLPAAAAAAPEPEAIDPGVSLAQLVKGADFPKASRNRFRPKLP